MKQKLSCANQHIYRCVPSDIFIHIFTFLDVPELCNICLTCKEFEKMGSCNYVWKNHLSKYGIVVESNASYRQLIKQKMDEIRERKGREKRELNRTIINISANIFKYNLLFKNIYLRKKHLAGKQNKYVNRFGDKLGELVKNNILTTNIYSETLQYYQLIKL